MLGSDVVVQLPGGEGCSYRKRIRLREMFFFLLCLEMLTQESSGKKFFISGQFIKRCGLLAVWKSHLFKPFEKLLVNFTQNLFCVLAFSIHPGCDLRL